MARAQGVGIDLGDDLVRQGCARLPAGGHNPWPACRSLAHALAQATASCPAGHAGGSPPLRAATRSQSNYTRATVRDRYPAPTNIAPPLRRAAFTAGLQHRVRMRSTSLSDIGRSRFSERAGRACC
jgi:hypothetical protein